MHVRYELWLCDNGQLNRQKSKIVAIFINIFKSTVLILFSIILLFYLRSRLFVINLEKYFVYLSGNPSKFLLANIFLVLCFVNFENTKK